MFKKNLRNIRLKQGLSQKQVADYLMVSPQSVSKWERGEVLPSIYYLPKLAEIFKCDVNAFFAPTKKHIYDIEMLKKYFSFMAAYVCDESKSTEKFLPFLNQYPNVLDVMQDFGKEIKQYQILTNKTVQGILDCSEKEAEVFIDYFIKHEMIEKSDVDGTYFVIKSNIDGLQEVLRVLIAVCSMLSKQ